MDSKYLYVLTVVSMVVVVTPLSPSKGNAPSSTLHSSNP